MKLKNLFRRIVLLSIATLLIISTIVGCSSEGPETTVKNFFDDLRNGRHSQIEKYFVKSEETIKNLNEDKESEMLFKGLFSKVNYEIIDTKVSGNKGEVRTKIKAPNIADIMGELIAFAFENALNEDVNIDKEMDNKINEILSDKELSYVTNEVTINLELKDGQWLIVPNQELINALTGDLLNFVNQFNFE
jgi:hypothetical protein